jgi:dihydrofolate reductase
LRPTFLPRDRELSCAQDNSQTASGIKTGFKNDRAFIKVDTRVDSAGAGSSPFQKRAGVRAWRTITGETMRKLIVSEFMSLDGVMQAPGGEDEDTEGGFKHGGWTRPYWDDAIGMAFGSMMQTCDAFLLGRKTYLIHGNAFEPMPPGDPFGDLMNAPAKYVVSKTLQKPVWRNTTIIRDNVVETIRTLKAAPGKDILTDGSHELVHTMLQHDLVDELHLLLYPLMLGSGKRLFPERAHATFKLKEATPYSTGVVGLHYVRAR